MKKIKRTVFYVVFALWTGALLSAAPSLKENTPSTLDGVYILGKLQPQGSTEYKYKQGVEVLMMYTDGKWVSVAYRKTDKKVVYTSGGSFSLNGGVLTETIEFHSVSLDKIGNKNTFLLKFDKNKFHKSGNDKGWKVEEYWLKELKKASK